MRISDWRSDVFPSDLYYPVKSIERPSKSNQASIVILRVFSEDSCVPKGIANAHIYTKRIEWVGCRNVRQVVPIESEFTTQRNLKSRHTSDRKSTRLNSSH